MLNSLVRWRSLFVRPAAPRPRAAARPATAGEPLAPTTPAPAAAPDPYAAWVVAAVWAGMMAVLVLFVAKYVSRVPLGLDDYCHIPLLFGTDGWSLSALWLQHNEHRIPLPRVLYAAAFALAGNDFRGPVVLDLLLLAAASVLLVQVVRRVRGYQAYTDAFIPLVMLHVGHWENVLWAFQVQFVSSATLGLAFLALVASPRFAASTPRVIAAGVVTLLLPLCGANGVALNPALGCYLLYVAARNLWSGERPLRLPGGVALAGGVAALAMVPLYFHGLNKCEHHDGPGNWFAVATNAVNFLGLSFGTPAHAGYVHGTQAFAVVGVAALVGLVATGGMLLAAARDPGRRAVAVGVGCVIGAVVSLGLGLAYGRGGMGSIVGCPRYVTLAMPLAVAVYVAWAVAGPARLGRAAQVVLLGLACAAAWPNTADGFPLGELHAARQKRIDFEMKTGMPLSFVVDRNVEPAHRDLGMYAFPELKRRGVEPFRHIADDPPMTDVPVEVNIVRTDGVTGSGSGSDGAYRVTGDRGTLVLALPKKRHVYGLRLVYEGKPVEGKGLVSLLSWEPGGAYPPRPGFGILGQVRDTKKVTSTMIFVDQETDTLRVDVMPAGCEIKIHGLSVLTRTD